MRIVSFPICFLLTLLLLTFSASVYAQQNAVVQLSGAKMRAALSLPKGNSTVQICGLEPGNTYKVIAVPMANRQEADFEIAPATALTKGTSNFAFMRDKKNAVSFAAPTACVDIQVKSSSTEKSDDVPMYLSIRCETCPESNAWLQKITGQADQAVLEVQGGFSAQELIEDVLVGGGCFQISDLSYEGQSNQIGTFSNGLTNIGFSEGVIMATGDISVAVGPNDSNSASFGFGIGTPDGDLGTLTTGATFDMANIEFDFVPTQNQVVFEFAFASEEYCEYVNTQFNDVFGFFISGPGIAGTKNIALIPSTNTPITINNLNHLVNSSLYTHNTTFTGNNCGIQPAFGAAVLELQYDGFTKKMVAVADVIPCQKYHIKLKIADVSDGVWDSAVFLRANSFDAGGEVLASPAYPGGFGVAYESCDSGNLLFKRGNGDTSQPLVINFTVGGSATPGVDYAAINSPVIIPVGETEVLVPVNVIPDVIAEGQENIILLIPNSCACTQGTVQFLINDRPALTLEAADQFLCAGETATLAASVSGGLPGYTYLWSTGETTASISPTTGGTYTLNVVDGCGGSASVTVALTFTACGGCDAETFIKTVGQLGQQVRGYGIYDSKDGNLYITGLKQDSAALIKMTPTGAVLWMRTFDVMDGANDRISEIIVDSEGMVVGCGQSGDVQPGVSGFVFRYNPATNNMQWINTYGLESTYVLGLVELPNGNYLIYDNPHEPVNDNRMLEITRPDGTIDFGSPLTQRLHLGNAENFNSATIHNGKLYGVGRYTNGIDFVNMRHALSRIDLATGNVDWSRLSHVPPNEPARLYGMDLVIEDNHIISVSFGSEVDGELDNGLIFMQKTDLSGNLIWVKRFNVTEAMGEVVDEVISVPDGFIMYAHGLKVPSDLYLIKTDKDGVLQWSKKVDYGFNDYVADISTFQSQILLNGNNLFFIASTEGPGASQMLVVKTKLDGTVEGNCDFIKPTLVETSDVINPANVAVILEQIPFNEETSTIVRMPMATNLLVEDQCEVFVNDSVDISLCLGETVVIGGTVYAQDTSFAIEIPGPGGCDTLRIYTIDVLPQPMRAENVTLCPGDSVIIGGQVIDQAGVFILSVDGVNGDCDTIVTYTVISSPFQTSSESISFCPGESVTIGGQMFNQSGTVIDTVASANACDTIVTYTLTLLPYQTRSESISFCPGESVTIGGQMFNQSGTVIDTVASATACDTIVTYTLTLLPYQTRSESISFCPGESVTIGGQMFNQSGTVIDTITSANACDTIVTYTLTLLPQPTRSESISFCPGESVTIGGQMFNQSGTVIDTIASANACDTIVTYTLTLLPQPTRSESISFCPGESVTIGGQMFNQSGTVIDTIASANACDTIVTYTLTLLPQPTRSESISFCPGESVTIGGQMFNQSGTVIDTIASANACDTIVTYTLTLLPQPTRSESISFCPGESVTIGGQMFNQSGTVIDTVASANACDTIVTYTLTLLPQPTLSETISFCPGETITLGGTGYTQPGTVVLTLNSSTGGCDTIATYTLQFSTPAPSSVGITCPASITIGQPSGGGGAVVTYNQPNSSSDCVCPGLALTMTSGLVSGSNFPTGTTAVCFTAKDSCGQSNSCCFNVTVEEEDPCDTKVVSCVKYELLTITEDMGKNRTYRIRVTNNCANKLIYTAIQIPDGLVAIAPADMSIYMAPSGNTYKVRSPNFSPQYSVRYSSISDSINNGESDIFKYTIPAQANVTFIHVVSRLAPYLYLGAHLNTFYCPIGVTPTTNNDRPGGQRDEEVFYDNGLVTELLLFPNPTSGELFADFSPWQGQRLNIQVLDSRGQRVQQISLTASDDAQALELPAELPSGLYFLEVLTEKGGKHTGRFVIQR